MASEPAHGAQRGTNTARRSPLKEFALWLLFAGVCAAAGWGFWQGTFAVTVFGYALPGNGAGRTNGDTLSTSSEGVRLIVERVERDAALISVSLRIEGRDDLGNVVDFGPTLLFSPSKRGDWLIRADFSNEHPRVATLSFPSREGASFELSIPTLTFDQLLRGGPAPISGSSTTVTGPWELKVDTPPIPVPIPYTIVMSNQPDPGFCLEVTEAFGATSAFIVRGQIAGAAHAGTGKMSVDGAILVPGGPYGPLSRSAGPQNRDIKFELMFPPQTEESIEATVWVVMHVARAELNDDQQVLELSQCPPTAVTLQLLR